MYSHSNTRVAIAARLRPPGLKSTRQRLSSLWHQKALIECRSDADCRSPQFLLAYFDGRSRNRNHSSSFFLSPHVTRTRDPRRSHAHTLVGLYRSTASCNCSADLVQTCRAGARWARWPRPPMTRTIYPRVIWLETAERERRLCVTSFVQMVGNWFLVTKSIAVSIFC